MAIGAAGQVYVADEGSNAIRVVDAKSANVTTVAGNGMAGLVDETSGAGERCRVQVSQRRRRRSCGQCLRRRHRRQLPPQDQPIAARVWAAERREEDRGRQVLPNVSPQIRCMSWIWEDHWLPPPRESTAGAWTPRRLAAPFLRCIQPEPGRPPMPKRQRQPRRPPIGSTAQGVRQLAKILPESSPAIAPSTRLDLDTRDSRVQRGSSRIGDDLGSSTSEVSRGRAPILNSTSTCSRLRSTALELPTPTSRLTRGTAHQVQAELKKG